MKLIVCKKCDQFISLGPEIGDWITCKCGASFGRYIGNLNAVYGGYAVPLGFNNALMMNAFRMRKQATAEKGIYFEAFFISETKCATFKKIRRPKELPWSKKQLKSIIPFRIMNINNFSVTDIKINIRGLEKEFALWFEFCTRETTFFQDNIEKWKRMVNYNANYYDSPFLSMRFSHKDRTYHIHSVFPKSLDKDTASAVINGETYWFPRTGESAINAIIQEPLCSQN